MKSVIVILSLIFCSTLSFAQRYVNQIFSEVDRSTVSYLDNSDLKMDIYQPRGDSENNRPVLVYVHGGGFSGGKRDESKIIDFCESMARRGMVVVSMSYTLTMKGQSFGCDQPAANKLTTFKQAGQEIAAATIYILNHSSELKINPNHIILSGSSAGAEAVLHAAYWSETQNHLPKDFKYAGVISMAGAIYDLGLITHTSAIPTQLFHGTCDRLVPYRTAPHHYCNEGDNGYLILHGASSIIEKLDSLKKDYYLVTGCNGGHEWNDLPMFEYKSEISDFIFNDVLKKRLRQIHEVVKSKKNCSQADILEVCLN